MANRRKHPSFAEMLADVTPRQQQQVPATHGFTADGRLIDPHGRIFQPIDDEISPVRATELLDRGAAVVRDECGCFGGCPLIWLDPNELERLRKAGRPVVRRRQGQLQEWRDDEGHVLVYLAGQVRWQ